MPPAESAPRSSTGCFAGVTLFTRQPSAMVRIRCLLTFSRFFCCVFVCGISSNGWRAQGMGRRRRTGARVSGWRFSGRILWITTALQMPSAGAPASSTLSTVTPMMWESLFFSLILELFNIRAWVSYRYRPSALRFVLSGICVCFFFLRSRITYWKIFSSWQPDSDHFGSLFSGGIIFSEHLWFFLFTWVNLFCVDFFFWNVWQNIGKYFDIFNCRSTSKTWQFFFKLLGIV